MRNFGEGLSSQKSDLFLQLWDFVLPFLRSTHASPHCLFTLNLMSLSKASFWGNI